MMTKIATRCVGIWIKIQLYGQQGKKFLQLNENILIYNLIKNKSTRSCTLYIFFKIIIITRYDYTTSITRVAVHHHSPCVHVYS